MADCVSIDYNAGICPTNFSFQMNHLPFTFKN